MKVSTANSGKCTANWSAAAAACSLSSNIACAMARNNNVAGRISRNLIERGNAFAISTNNKAAPPKHAIVPGGVRVQLNGSSGEFVSLQWITYDQSPTPRQFGERIGIIRCQGQRLRVFPLTCR